MADRDEDSAPQVPGHAENSRFDPTAIDPTKNVEDLVNANKAAAAELRIADRRYIDSQLNSSQTLQNFAREAEAKLQTLARESQNKLYDALRDAEIRRADSLAKMHENETLLHTALSQAETRRIDQLAQTRQEFQNTIRDMLAESVRTTSTLVSTQLVQIQATFDTRVSKLEAGAFTQAGKSSVADPQLADFMRMMSQSLTSQGSSTTEMFTKMTSMQAEATAKMTLQLAALGAKESTGEGRRMGQGQVIAWIVAGFMLLAAVAGPIIAIVSMRGH